MLEMHRKCLWWDRSLASRDRQSRVQSERGGSIPLTEQLKIETVINIAPIRRTAPLSEQLMVSRVLPCKKRNDAALQVFPIKRSPLCNDGKGIGCP
jgi:hypothetical protein